MAVYRGEHRLPPTTLNAELAVQLSRLETAFALLSVAEQQDVLAELEPIVRVARARVQLPQPSRMGPPLLGRITA